MSRTRISYVDNYGNKKTGYPETKMACITDSPFSLLKRSTTYTAGTLVYSNKLPSWGILECKKAGTTAVNEPSEISATKNSMGYDIQDGTVTWLFRHRDGTKLPGEVFAFSGSITNKHPTHGRTGLSILNYWLCDGTNGTPDLRDRMIVGSGNKYPLGAAAGEETVTLGVAQMPVHDHGLTISDNNNLVGRLQVRAQNPNSSGIISVIQTGIYSDGNADDNHDDEIIQINCNHGHSGSIQKSGGNQAHNNMPPYYALAFIVVK